MSLLYTEIEKLVNNNGYIHNHIRLNRCGYCGTIDEKFYIFKESNGGMPVRCFRCKDKVRDDTIKLTKKDIFTIKCLI